MGYARFKILGILFSALLIQHGVFGQSLNPFVAGTIQPGDSVVIYYDVTINTGCGCSQISNQGTVNGSNFSFINTDDPDTAPAGDPTITLLNMFPLPVNFVQFKGSEQGGKVYLEWKVAEQLKVESYAIERSEDGINYYIIGSIATVIGSGQFTYNFTDDRPVIGKNFYRIRSLDIDHHSKLTNTLRIDLTTERFLSIFPNPVFNRVVTLQFNNYEKGGYEIAVYNKLGQILFTSYLKNTGSSMSQQLFLPQSTIPGLYHIVIQGPAGVTHQTILVQ